MAKKEISIVIRAKNAVAAGLAKAGAMFKSFGASVKNIGAGLLSFGKNAAIGFGAAIGALGVLMKKAEEFNQSISQIATLTEVSKGKVAKEVRAMSAEFGMAKDELTKGLYDALSASVPKDNVFDFMRTAAKTARAGASSTAEAVDFLTTAINAYGFDAAQAGRISDILFATVKLGKTTVSELAANFAQVAPLASASGIAFDQVMAAAASLTKQGTPTAQAMTQIRAAIIAMNRELGDGWAASMTLQEGMQLMMDKAGGSANALKGLTGRVEGALAIMALTGKGAAGAAKDLAEVANSTGAMNDAFKKTNDDAAMAKFLQALHNISLAAGDVALKFLGPMLERASKAAASFAEKIAILTDTEKFKQTQKAMEGIVSALLKGGPARGDALKAVADVIVEGFKLAASSAVSILMKAAPSIGKLIGAGATAAMKALKPVSLADLENAYVDTVREYWEAGAGRKIYQERDGELIAGQAFRDNKGDVRFIAEDVEKWTDDDVALLKSIVTKRRNDETMKRMGIEGNDIPLDTSGLDAALARIMALGEKYAPEGEGDTGGDGEGEPLEPGQGGGTPYDPTATQRAALEFAREQEAAQKEAVENAVKNEELVRRRFFDKQFRKEEQDRDRRKAKEERMIERALEKEKKGITGASIERAVEIQKAREQVSKEEDRLKQAEEARATLEKELADATKRTADAAETIVDTLEETLKPA
jgi:TP901 family phage tail tape measure protein